MIGPHTPQRPSTYVSMHHTRTAAESARIAKFMAGYDAGRHNRVVVLSDDPDWLSDDPDWLDGFLTGRCDRANA